MVLSFNNVKNSSVDLLLKCENLQHIANRQTDSLNGLEKIMVVSTEGMLENNKRKKIQNKLGP